MIIIKARIKKKPFRYECTAINDYGRVTKSIMVKVRDDAGLILRAFKEATREIDRAINNTLEHFFNPNIKKTNQFHLSRFPNAIARSAARPAELFERTLAHVRRMIESNYTFYANATDNFQYEKLLNHNQVLLILYINFFFYIK